MTLRTLILATALAVVPHPAVRANPLIPGADPHAAVIGDNVWIYPTQFKGGRNFFAYESADLKNWREHGPILDFRDIPWIHEDGRTNHGPWAPCIVEHSGRYYFYFSVGPQSAEHPSRIGVAVADSPAGPFKDSGKPLLTGGGGFEAIDPMVYKDPASGIHYFYAGGSDGATLRVFELDDSMTAFRREISVETPRKFTEGAFIHHHGGKYHFTYSHGGFRDASYSVHYSTADSAIGPWTYRGVLLESDQRHMGPGHHSIIRFPSDGPWWIVYHRWNNRPGDRGPYSGTREIAIDRITYDSDGFLQPVVMTDDLPSATSD